MESSLQKNPRFKHLYDADPEFRQLSDEHIKLKNEVRELEKARYLSSEMDAKMKELKKRKLEVKDKLESMLEKKA